VTQPQRHILVVDDLADNRGILVQMMLRQGYRVSQAANGAEALELVRRDRPDLMLLDLMMPVMDGFGVLQQLESAPEPFLPVIVVTAATEREARLRALRSGAHEFINKPVDIDEVAIRVRTLLKLKDANEELGRLNAALHDENRRIEAVVDERTQELQAAYEELQMSNEELQVANEELQAQSEEALRMNEALERQQRFTERVLQNVPVGIAYLDRDLIFRTVNPALTKRYGLSAEDMLGRSIYEVFPEERDRLRPILEAELTTGEPFFAQSVAEARGGHWDVSHFPLRGAEDQVDGILVLAVDVSDRVGREQAQAERVAYLEAVDRYKDEFLSVISHELRTPLNFIMGFASILEDLNELDPTQQVYVSKILEGADRMLALVNDLLDVARINAGRVHLEPEPTRYADVIDRVVSTLKPLADKKRQTVAVSLDVPEPQVMDPHRITQVLTNLVGNAVKFTPDGGRIEVKARMADGALLTEVIDTGVGIPAEHAEAIFERFVQVDMSPTREAGGTGLGLSISKSLVEAHGGAIGVHSAPGEGSTFWFTLPQTPVDQREPEPAAPLPRPDRVG
jgi:two-component system CheB/CheR fusion protein